jgi:flagellar basal body-associated protein FliL
MSDVDDDLSASTQRFQAFAQRPEQEPPAPWEMRAPASKIWILIAIVIVVAVIAAILAFTLAG